MSFKDKRVLVTGGAGVIGRPLVLMLQRAGADIWVGDLKSKPEVFDDRIKYRWGDLNTLTERELHEFKPEYLFHLAASFERTVENFTFWEDNSKNNLQLSHKLGTMMRDLKSLKAVIFASSYLVYDSSQYLFDLPSRPPYLKEGNATHPRNLTGAAKLYHEAELEFLQKFLGHRAHFYSARIYRSFGRGSQDIISRWVRELLQDQPIKVFGTENHFDYIFADDVAEGLFRIGNQLPDAGVYNLANGNAHPIREVVDILRESFPNLQEQIIDFAGPYEFSRADMDKTFSTLKWKPRYSLKEGIKEVIEHEKLSLGAFGSRKVGNILVTSASKKVPLLQRVRRSADKLGQEQRVFAADSSPKVLSRHFADEFWTMPRLEDLSVDILKNYCKSNEIEFIIPTRDGELSYFTHHKEALKASGIHVMVSGPETIRITQDKLVFYRHMKDAGFPVIKTSDSLEQMKDHTLLVVKEKIDSGSRSLHLGVSSQEAEQAAATMTLPIFQPQIVGREFSADVYRGKQGVHGVMLRTRDVIVAGESQVTTPFQNEQLEALITEATDFLGIEGHAVWQGMIDAKGDYHLIEVNARVGGASTFSFACGLDSIYWFMLEASDHGLYDYPYLPDYTKKLVRHPQDFLVSL